jgi:hypothetical protein
MNVGQTAKDGELVRVHEHTEAAPTTSSGGH